MKKAILFDLDGTLWDSSEQVTQAWNVCLRDRLHRTEQITVEDMHRFMGKTISQIAAMLFPELPEEERVSYLTACTDYERDYLSTLTGSAKPPVYADEQAIIRSLQQDYTLGIVSNCQVGYIEVYLSQQSFADAFSDHECAEKTGLSKGQNIRLVMERLGITDCIYVGDTQGDAEAAREAGVKFVYAAYGFGEVDGCDAEIDDLRKLPETAAKLI